MCLEFSKVQNPILKEIYKFYSFNVIPQLGSTVAGDKPSYQYLVESIERFLTQEQLLAMMEDVGMQKCSYENFTDGIVALHSGYKLK
jgi:2-methoxy-6-polyprenyl-1,4-benzoquinol methylase